MQEVYLVSASQNKHDEMKTIIMLNQIRQTLNELYPDVTFKVVQCKSNGKPINQYDVYCFTQQHKCRITLDIGLLEQSHMDFVTWIKAEIGKYVNNLLIKEQSFR